jgi:ATP-dependent DNA helicase PIF1
MIMSCLGDYDLVLAMGIDKTFCIAGSQVLRGRHDFEDRQLEAFVGILRGRNVFVTGGGGTGKSYVTRVAIKALRTALGDKAVAVIAPTGIAAWNVGGVTMDSYLGCRPLSKLKEYPQGVISKKKAAELGLLCITEEEDEEQQATGPCFGPVANEQKALGIHNTKVLFLDESSMVFEGKFKLMKAVLDYYRNGKEVQVVSVGDFAQLPPVVTRNSLEEKSVSAGVNKTYCFQGHTWRDFNFLTVELDISRRCAHVEWNTVLSQIRMGAPITGAFLDRVRDLTAGNITLEEVIERRMIGIYGRNNMCHEHDNRAYASIQGPEYRAVAQDSPSSDDRVPKTLPVVVKLKAGARVMITRNMMIEGEFFANGTLATVEAVPTGRVDVYTPITVVNHALVCSGGIGLRLDDDDTELFLPAIIDRRVYEINDIKEMGSRANYPLKIASAFTIHRSQGRTFRVPHVVDGGTLWKMSGMAYTALSRTSDPAVLHINNLEKMTNYIDPEVLVFYRGLRNRHLSFFCRSGA